MECNAFHHWLRTRDGHNKQDSPGAMAHQADCSDCQQLYALDTRAEQGVALAFASQDLPRDLAEKIDQRLDLESPPSIFNGFISKHGRFKRFAPLAGFPAILVGFMALVMILAGVFTLHTPSFKNLEQISEQAVTDHLKGNQEISFDTTALYQAREMFKRELGFNVLLPNLDSQGVLLVGGRLCTLGKCRAAYFVIKKQGRTGSLFIMDTDYLDFEIADKSRFSTTIKGCAAEVWKDNGQVYAMVF